MTQKHVNILMAIISLAVCIVIATALRSYPFIRGFLGDTIVISLVYFSVKSFKDFPNKYLAIGSVLFAYIIEISQYFHLVHILGLEHNTVMRIILGSTFDVKDMAAYTIGGAVAYSLDSLFNKKLFIS